MPSDSEDIYNICCICSIAEYGWLKKVTKMLQWYYYWEWLMQQSYEYRYSFYYWVWLTQLNCEDETFDD